MSTWQDIRDVADWQCQIGRGKFEVRIDRRGGFCINPPCPMEGIAIPEEGHISDVKAKIGYLRAVPI